MKRITWVVAFSCVVVAMVVHAIALVVAMRELGPASLTVAVAALSCPALLWGLIQLADLACMDKWVNASSKDDDP